MHFKNIRIKTLLIGGNAVMFLTVIFLGIYSYNQSGYLHQQFENLYEHPLKVRRALGELKYSVSAIHLGMKDLFLVGNQKGIEDIILKIKVHESEAYRQIEIIQNQYLGPQVDVIQLKADFDKWNVIRLETIRLLQTGNTEVAKLRTLAGGAGGDQAALIYLHLEKISSFALNKSDEFYANVVKVGAKLDNQLVLITTLILAFSLLTVYFVIRNINIPVKEMVRASKAFSSGDYSQRVEFQSRNEFGLLSESLNYLAETVQSDAELNSKLNKFSEILIHESDPTHFFRVLLTSLCEITHSQAGCIFLVNEEDNEFRDLFSIGLDKHTRKSFPATAHEGELGLALSTRSVQHIRDIPADTRFTLNMTTGNYIPKEILVIPVVSGNQVMMLISLASVNAYSLETIRFIHTAWNAITAKTEGVIAYQKNLEFSDKLAEQNLELETQKTELFKQSSELMEQNTELEYQKKQLDEANRLKTNFLSNMSHELRTPLNSVIALSGVLSRRLSGKIPGEELGFLEVIERNGKLLLSLINDILDLSRIEAGREEVEIIRFDIHELMEDVVSLLRPQAMEKNIGLVQKIPADFPMVSSDFGKCRHILQNIVGNAVKFTESGEVIIAATFDEKNIRIIITDTGIGIAKEHIEHIFDEFRQADGSTARKFGGTGLGLAIARKYAHLLGGMITVTSEPGKGSEFVLHLPVSFEYQGQEYDDTYSRFKKPITGAEPRTMQGKTILIIDDSEPAVIQLKYILEKKGYKTLVAHGGEEAFTVIDGQIPDGIILDLMMPGTDGFELLKRIRANQRTENIPVLILTALHITRDELRVLKKNNISQLIQKGSINAEELLKNVDNMLLTVSEAYKPAESIKRPVAGKPGILVVEDNPDNMTTVKAILGDIFTVFEAVDGEEGLKLAQKHMPDLILMDIALPGMDGIACFKAIRSIPGLQHIPVIALTASAMTSDRETILAYGFDAYISKPIDDKLFFKTVKSKLYGE